MTTRWMRTPASGGSRACKIEASMAYMRQRADSRTERDVELYAQPTKSAEDPELDADYHELGEGPHDRVRGRVAEQFSDLCHDNSLDQRIGGAAVAEQDRIDAAITMINGSLGEFGVTLVAVQGDASVEADIHLQFAPTSVIGGLTDGVLGVMEAGGAITIITGWDYCLGADAAAIGAGQYDFGTVVTHELSHAVGLGHGEDGGSVMYPYLGTADIRRELTFSDITAVREVEEGGPEALMAKAFTLTSQATPAIVGPSQVPILESSSFSVTPLTPATAPLTTAAPPTMVAHSPISGTGFAEPFALQSTTTSSVPSVVGNSVGSRVTTIDPVFDSKPAAGQPIEVGSIVRAMSASTDAETDGYLADEFLGVWVG